MSLRTVFSKATLFHYMIGATAVCAIAPVLLDIKNVPPKMILVTQDNLGNPLRIRQPGLHLVSADDFCYRRILVPVMNGQVAHLSKTYLKAQGLQIADLPANATGVDITMTFAEPQRDSLSALAFIDGVTNKRPGALLDHFCRREIWPAGPMSLQELQTRLNTFFSNVETKGISVQSIGYAVTKTPPLENFSFDPVIP